MDNPFGRLRARGNSVGTLWARGNPVGRLYAMVIRLGDYGPTMYYVFMFSVWGILGELTKFCAYSLISWFQVHQIIKARRIRDRAHPPAHIFLRDFDTLILWLCFDNNVFFITYGL